METTNGTSPQHDSDVCIVGAGPTGLILAINLAQAGLKVTILEASPDFSNTFRAVGHIPPVFPEFKKAGILEQTRKASTAENSWIYFRRTTDKKIIDEIPGNPDRPGPMIFPQAKLTRIMVDRLADFGDQVELLMGHEVVGFEDHGPGKGVTVEARDISTDTTKTYNSKYMVGADGSKSFIRRTLGLSYTGQTMPFKLVAADLFYPFEKYGWDGANFMLDGEHFGNIAKIDTVDGETLWRVGTGFPVDMTHDEILSQLPNRYRAMFPHDDDTTHPLTYRHHTTPTPYEAHHFCVPRLRSSSNTFLIGDAAHIANPFSGQVLACGIFDASSLSDCLVAVDRHGAPESLLDAWSDDRRHKFQTVLDPLAKACFEAVSHPDPEGVAGRHPFLKAAKAMKAGKGGPPPSLATRVEGLEGWRGAETG